MHGCVLSSVTNEALVLKLLAISIHIAEKIFIVLDQFHAEILQLKGTLLDKKITFIKENTQFSKG